MANVTQLDVRVDTGNSGTNGKVFLGIGGREFRLDVPGRDDFRSGRSDEFRLGSNSNVANSEHNSPSTDLRIDHHDLGRFPVYLRLDGGDPRWDLNYVRVTATYSGGSRTFRALHHGDLLALGDEFGRYVYLREMQ